MRNLCCFLLCELLLLVFLTGIIDFAFGRRSGSDFVRSVLPPSIYWLVY